MRRNTMVVSLCVAAGLAVAGSAVQAAAAPSTGAGPHAGAARKSAPAASRSSQTGVITGLVLGASARPLAGACVTATARPAGADVASQARATGTETTRTSASGRYFFGGLAAGRYWLRYHACAHPAGPDAVTEPAVVPGGQIARLAPVTLRPPRLPAPGSDGTGAASPARVAITRPAVHRVTLAELRRQGSQSGRGGISGRVTDAAGHPVKGLCAMTYFPHDGGILGSGTSARGTYRTGMSLPPGQYTVQFGTCFGKNPAGNWAPQWYHGKYSQARADTVTVKAGMITKGIDAVMRHGGIISGVVTGKHGARLSGVCVTAVTPDGKQDVAQVKTVRGRYRIGSLDAGRYRVYFQPACGHATPYLDQWWPGASTVKGSKPASVRLGKVTGHVDAALTLGGMIKGTVRFENSRGKPLAGICVFGSGLGPVSTVEADGVTKKDGTFALEGLPAGRYQLSFGAVGCGNNGNYVYYNDPHPVRVDLGGTAHVLVFMKPGAIISGTVTSAATGQPLSGICVYVNDYFGDGGSTGADGKFRIDQLPPGRYSVSFYGGCGNNGSYAPQWFRGRAEPFNAARVVLRAGKLTSGIDAAMRPGSAISGVVTSSAGVPLGGICIGAYTPSEAGYLFGVFGDFYNGQTRHGAYQITNLAPGQYQIVFFTCGSRPGWTSQWYRSAAALGAAGLLDVPAATTVTGINATMTRGGAISGTVRGPAGQPYSFTCIIVTSLTSGASESTEADAFPSGLTVRYAIGGLAPGRYRVEFYDCGDGGATQWYSHKSTPGAADPVTVREGQVTKRISAVLATPASVGSISGRVTSRSTGKPVPSVCVTASSPAVYRGARTGARGDYTITHLPSGRYQLYFASCRGDRYAAEARRAKVLVRAPDAVRGVNFAVTLAGSVSGAVAGGSSKPAPRPGTCVTAMPLSRTAQPGYAVSRRGGAYAIGGLAPGRYHVYFDPVGCIYGAMPFAPQWYSGQASKATADPVTVRAGGKSVGIDAMLARDGTIAGTVTGPPAAGAPLSGICVQAAPTGALARAGDPVYTVSQSGKYALTDLPPGRYLVSFTSGCGASGYAAQWWQGASTRAAATAVTVAPGAVTGGIDAALHS